MLYVLNEGCSVIYMVSHKKTKKYANLISNPSVSLLIDTREEERGDRRTKVKALTVSGEFQTSKCSGKKRPYPGTLLLQKHPYLMDFINDPDAEIFLSR